MKSLKGGEKIRDMFQVDCKHGHSNLYITNLGIMVESNLGGTILELGHSLVLSLQPIDKKQLKLIWKEKDNTYSFELVSKNPQEITLAFGQAQKDYNNALKQIGVKVNEMTEQIKVENTILDRGNEQIPIQQIKRFAKVPEYVKAEEIWNDCWLDSKFYLYVTHNKYLAKRIELLSRPHQIKYRIESKDIEGIVAKPDKVVLKFGIPAVNLEIEGKKVWFLLPTMSKTLLSREIEAARFSQEPSTRIEFVSE